jgi:hypothetical protein
MWTLKSECREGARPSWRDQPVTTRKAPADKPAFRSPIRASIIPDCGGPPAMGVPTATSCYGTAAVLPLVAERLKGRSTVFQLMSVGRVQAWQLHCRSPKLASRVRSKARGHLGQIEYRRGDPLRAFAHRRRTGWARAGGLFVDSDGGWAVIAARPADEELRRVIYLLSNGILLPPRSSAS